MLIYVRHSDDDMSNPTYKHDPKLNKHGKRLAHKEGKRLLKYYGIPTIIYCSPFRRTRETLKYMLYSLSDEERDQIEIIWDAKVSRYFRKSEKKHPQIDGQTYLDDELPIYETYADFTQRVIKRSRSIEKHIDSKDVVWCITHTTVYKRLSKIYNVTIPAHIPFMHNFILPEPKAKREWCDDCAKYHYE